LASVIVNILPDEALNNDTHQYIGAFLASVIVNILPDEALNNDTHQYIGAFICILYRYEERLI